MTKFTYEQKLAAVKLYLEGQSSGEIIKKFNIGEHAQLRFWVKQYKRHGPNILNPKKKHEEYSGEFKLNVLNWKKQYHETYEATAVKFGISNPGTIYQWQKAKDKGDLVASNKKRGRPPLVKKQKKISPLSKSEREELERLRKENRSLFIENEYLKKLDALIQNREQNKKNGK
ncbi:helix-turn-helix domain-containing protein [Lactobacillus rodentium]|uniref:Transposase n=1 Tax=Lactobacillus rodentium TaxID=947835 RepID=A0A2Z6TUU1_9LACO|nr:helix-turn-helix domain-containing protein [Lactobacillus rodentium]GBG05499.1 transposase [Lactobacillus rodentium]